MGGFSYFDPSNTQGGSSGGPLDGTLNVTVLDSDPNSYQQPIPGVTVVLGVDPQPQARVAAAVFGIETAPQFEDALANSNVDAVILCTPQQYHAEQIVAAARTGRHVFCEKPLCSTSANAETAIAAVRKAGIQ